jgi:hypothetical protein
MSNIPVPPLIPGSVELETLQTEDLKITGDLTVNTIISPDSDILTIKAETLDLEGHLQSSGPVPTAIVGSGTFLGGVALGPNSTDTCGRINCTNAGAALDEIKVTYSTPFPVASFEQHVFVSARNTEAADSIALGYWTATDSDHFAIHFTGATAAGASFNYFVIDSYV